MEARTRREHQHEQSQPPSSPHAQPHGPGWVPPPLRSFALAALCEYAEAHGAVGDGPELALLRAHRARVCTDGGSWHERYCGCRGPEDRGLAAVAEALALSDVEQLSIALLMAVEDEPLVGRAVAALQAPVGGSRPSLGLLAAAFAAADDDAGERRPAHRLFAGPAAACGVVEIEAGPPLSERTLSIPPPLHLALSGDRGVWPGVAIGLGASEVELTPSLRAAADQQVLALRGTDRALILRCASRSEGRAIAALMARALDLEAAFIETTELAGLGVWLQINDLLPVFTYELGPSESRALPALPGYRGPVLVLLGLDGTVSSRSEDSLSWTVPIPATEEREQLWTELLGDARLARELAGHHRHGCGRISQLGRQARHRAEVQHRRPTCEDVLAAALSGEGSGLGGLAEPLAERIPDEALVLPDLLRRDMEFLLARCRNRDGLADGFGPALATRYRPGVRVLFVGPSGTGKTLAAGWLASRLEMPLYRVDLASVTSKYIGETEKNLAQLMARAEDADVVLLFDEADSIFGARTEVRSSNDRFANAQTNYLLQRIESFEGIAILTSNSRARFDMAFARRFDMTLDFPPPDQEQRRLLWLGHLGKQHALSPPEVERLAAAAELTGGQIRLVVVDCAVAARTQQRKVRFDDVLAALDRQYRQLGRPMPDELVG